MMLYTKLIDYLNEVSKALDKIIYNAERRLKNAPVGMIHTNTCRGYLRYSVRLQSNEEKYIRKSDKGLISRLSQKAYDRKLIKYAIKNKVIVQKMISELEKNNMDTIADTLCIGIKDFVQKYELTDEEYAENWGRVTWKKNEYCKPGTYITENGELVRSKSEVLIANLLKAMGIPYRYEYPYRMKKADGSGWITIYPDFTILNKRTRKEYVLEHLGLMSDPDYVKRTEMKVYTYFSNGWYLGDPLLITMETNDKPLDLKAVKRMFEKYLL